MKKTERQHYLRFTLELAHEAGKILLAHQKELYKRPLKLINKGAHGLACEADICSEALVIKKIRRRFPDHHIVAEEDSFARQLKVQGPETAEEFTWLIDPLDGTNNFLNGLPFFCVSLALMQGHEVIVGVVHNPILGETFYATRGDGAFMERRFGREYRTKKLKASQSSQPLKDALISTNLGSHRHNAELIRKFPEVRAFRRLGSAALELAYVAAGILDVYWEYQLQPWDIAAGGLICQEAGVPISDLNGRSFHPFTPSVLVARSTLYADLRDILTTPRKS